MYTVRNFRTKKALREAVANNENVRYFQPGPFGGQEAQDGAFCLEGPHYPEAHKWYAQATAKAGIIVAIK